MVSYWRLAVLIAGGILVWFAFEAIYSDRAAHFMLLVYALLGIKVYQWLGLLHSYVRGSPST